MHFRWKCLKRSYITLLWLVLKTIYPALVVKCKVALTCVLKTNGFDNPIYPALVVKCKVALTCVLKTNGFDNPIYPRG